MNPKQIVIIRHGKAADEGLIPGDMNRPLMKKGISRTCKTAQFISSRSIKPGEIISSPALRAHETAKLLAGFFHFPDDHIRIENRLYAASTADIFNAAFTADNETESLFIVGHNPGLTDFANLFLTQKIFSLPTSGCVALQFNVQKWTDIPLAKAALLFICSPKSL